MLQRDKGLAGPHQSGHFETVYFFTWICVDGFLNCTGEQFQKDACLVSGFTGFVLTIDRFVLEIIFGLKNVRICVDVAYASRYGKKNCKMIT